jgi:hypothetical protein
MIGGGIAGGVMVSATGEPPPGRNTIGLQIAQTVLAIWPLLRGAAGSQINK